MTVCLILTLLIGQNPKEVVVRPYQDARFIYYTITAEMTGGWAMTGFESKASPEQGIRWLTAAHYFPLSMKPAVIPASINGKTEYINEIARLGSDLCVFRFGPDSTFVVKGFSPRGSKESFTASMDISLDYEEPLGSAFYLVDHRDYQVVGSVVVHDDDGDVNGVLIGKESESGDCGTAFLYDGQVCVITKSIPPGLPTPQGETVEPLTVAVPLTLTP